MSAYKLNIRKKISEIEIANNNPCNSLKDTKYAVGTILLGSTGGGKTTLLEFLLDNALTVGVKYGNPYLDSQSNHIGHGGEAKTDQVMIHTYAEDQIFIDTPGFGDTRGEYTEIKNHIAIRNIVECDKIAGVRMVFVVPKSFIFYEANRGTDLNKFVKAVRNFIPDFSAKKWIDQTLIIVTKTESRTTTSNAIEAIKDGIEEIREAKEVLTIITKEEKDFFKYLTDNQRVKLFPMPKEPYNISSLFKDPELRKDILGLINKMPVVKVTKDDFKKDFQLQSTGDIINDFNRDKTKFIKEAQITESDVEKNVKEYIKSFPRGALSTKEYKNTKKVLEDYIKHQDCNEKDGLFKDISQDFNGINKLVSDFCELDYSVKFLKKYTSHSETLFTIETEREKVKGIIEKAITYCDWEICTRNAYSTFFKFLIQREQTPGVAKNIDTLLKQNFDGYQFFGHSTKEDIRNAIFDDYTKENAATAKDIKRKLFDLRDSNKDDNALDQLIKFVSAISEGEYPHYNECKIKGFMPSVSQFTLDNAALAGCAEIAIYGVYGIKIAGPLELPKKNLIMIAPYIKVMEDQKIKLDGLNAAQHREIHDNNGKDGAAGNVGSNGGSFYGYCIGIGGGKLTISTRGGNGGDGQHGAHGKNQNKGLQALKKNLNDDSISADGNYELLKNKVNHLGWTWYQKIRCTDTGQEGEVGGKGGTGGEGGYGGFPGEVDFQIKGASKDKDKYYSSITIEGKKGEDGLPGEGGYGGDHGDGLCYVVHYVDTPWVPWQVNLVYGFHHLRGNVPKMELYKEIPLPSKDDSITYNNLKYPSLDIHEKAPDGSAGNKDPINKSKIPLKNAKIDQTKHINEYVDFISKVQNIKDLIQQEDADGKSLSVDNSEILDFFANLQAENCSPPGYEYEFG